MYLSSYSNFAAGKYRHTPLMPEHTLRHHKDGKILSKLRLLPLFTIVLLSILGRPLSAQDVAEGEKLFKQNCAQCHSVGDNRVVGPGLKGVADRVPKPAEEWLIAWIKNSQALVKAGDAYAVKIFEEYNKSVMPAQALTDDQVKSVLAYIANPPQKAGPKDPAADLAASGKDAKGDSDLALWFLIGLIVLFVVLLNVLNRVKSSLERLVRQRDGLPEPVKLAPAAARKVWIRSNKKLIAVVLIFLTAVGSKAAWDGMMGIGVYEGYMPEQPIWFSHKIHAGQNAINCVYCHSGVEKSRYSGIPSANVCMNCHKAIQQGAISGKTEIAKIYAALDYNPEKGTYGPNPKPIRWVKVHSLPEHAYFNHAQHVKVGKVDCATCHGPIEKMDTVYQVSSLTMGWCIDCHRKTEVKMAGNTYYNELHAKLAEKYKGQPITVNKMGGIECGKCHY